MKMQLINILGAGVAGLTAAINLTNAGFDVHIHERAPDCGRRFAGDLQGLENWTREEDVLKEIKHMGIKPKFYHAAFRKATITNMEESIEMKFRRPMFYLVKRGTAEGSLDQSLKKQAIDSGVQIHFNARFPEQNAHMIATGPKRSFFAIDKGIVFETDMKDTASIVVNNELAYGGYSYLLVAKGYGCMCTVVFHKLQLVNECWAKTRKTFEKMHGLDVRKEHGCGGVGDFMLERRLEEGGRLYAGEAAGLQDFLWGFGIRNAVVSGYLSARSISEGIDYEKSINARLGSLMKAAVVNRYMWEKFGKSNYRQFFRMARKQKDMWEFMHKMYSFDAAHKLVYPFALRRFRKKAA